MQLNIIKSIKELCNNLANGYGAYTIIKKYIGKDIDIESPIPVFDSIKPRIKINYAIRWIGGKSNPNNNTWIPENYALIEYLKTDANFPMMKGKHQYIPADYARMNKQ